jgi:putative effector of murein hydrolase
MRAKDLWKFKFFWDIAENAKNDANILKKHIFLDFHCFSLFLDFSKILSKRWVKNWVTTNVIFQMKLILTYLELYNSRYEKYTK